MGSGAEGEANPLRVPSLSLIYGGGQVTFQNIDNVWVRCNDCKVVMTKEVADRGWHECSPEDLRVAKGD